jgi:pyruvate dehydrogenase E2 component (dihydrolipoamide acetyltransferase)
MNIKIPHIAEGISSGTVVSILVKEGDQVKKDQTVLELETEKAVAPIPAPEDGVVSKVLVTAGQTVNIGQDVIILSAGGGAAKPAAQEKPSATAEKPKQTAVPSQQPAPVTPAAGEYHYESKSGLPPPASPTVRKVARELGIDLTRVRGREHGGRIVMEDIKAYIQGLQQAAAAKSQQPSPRTERTIQAESIDFSKWGPVTKKPVSTLRKKIGQKMADAWATIPHVTQFDEADITALLQLKKKYNSTYEEKGVKLTLTVLIAKAVVALLKKYPMFNSSLDELLQEIVFKEYYHLGIAVDTEQGLIVPVLKDADKKNMLEISKELQDLAEKTRQRKVSLDDLQGGTFTISNLGSIGGMHFTPIVNKPEVAILGLGRGVQKPVILNGKMEARMMLPVCLSYDHRVVDGADGARFIKDLVNQLENFDEAYFKAQGTSASDSKKESAVKQKGKK